MKALIRSDKGTSELVLFADNYDDAVRECAGLQEDGIILPDEEVIAIIN